MFQPVTISSITKLTEFNKKYGLLDGIGDSSIGSNKTQFKEKTKKNIDRLVQLQVLLNLRNLTRNAGYWTIVS